jgi:hypothetical protein
MQLRMKLCGQNVKFRDVTVNSNFGGKILAVSKQFMVSALLLICRESVSVVNWTHCIKKVVLMPTMTVF